MLTTEKILAIKGSAKFSFWLFLFLIPVLSIAEARQTQPLTGTGGAFHNAVSIDVTPTGSIFITEKDRHRFIVLNPEGLRTDSTGNQGRGNYQFDSPVSVDATNGLKIYIADRNNRRVQIFDRRFQYLSTINESQIRNVSSFRPELLAVNRLGELFVYDSERLRLYKFDINGNYEMSLDLRSQLIRNVDRFTVTDNQLLILVKSNGTLHRFNFDGIYEGFLGGFEDTAAVRFFDGRLWAVKPGELTQLNRSGQVTGRISFDPAIEVTDFVIHKNHAYLLTGYSLYKLQIPQL